MDGRRPLEAKRDGISALGPKVEDRFGHSSMSPYLNPILLISINEVDISYD